MTRTKTLLAALAVAPALLLSHQAAFAEKKKNNSGAIAAGVIGGLIAGAAIGAAVSGTTNQPKTIYVPTPPPPPPKPNPWANVYKPQPNMSCYPAQQACYNSQGVYSSTWTRAIYGRG